MDTQLATWKEVSELLREARNVLPVETNAIAAVPVGLLAGTLQEFEEFLEHNELELAWDALAAIAEPIDAPPAFWRRLACAAGLMRLLHKEEQAAQRAIPRVPCEQALAIARQDAEKAYRELFAYRISIVMEADGWHIDYELKDPSIHGGGPHYVIDPENGSIVKKRYEQ